MFGGFGDVGAGSSASSAGGAAGNTGTSVGGVSIGLPSKASTTSPVVWVGLALAAFIVYKKFK